MLRDLLVRVSAGLLSAAIAVSCAHTEDKPTEQVGVVDQALTPGGAGGQPAVGAGGAADVAGAGGQPATCDVAACEAPGTCTHCVGNACLNYAAVDKHECRAKADLCDVAEVCQGAATCPTDAVVAKDVQCRAANGKDCDIADVCDGKTVACVDSKQPNTHQCRGIKAGAACDVAENCAGGDDCPVDGFTDSSVQCRAAKDDCDVAEKCTGKAADCPADAKVGDGQGCSSNANKCLVGTSCLAGVCVGGAAKTCIGDTACVNAGTCNNATGNCDYVAKPATTLCDDGIACTVGDHCSSGVCLPGTTTDNACPKHVCAAVTCDISALVLQQFPDGCKIVPVQGAPNCRNVAAGDVCDVAEKCDGVSPDCPPVDAVLPAGTQCVAAACTTTAGQASSQVKLSCDGTSKKCPVATPVSCGGYACNGTVCNVTCADDSACQDDHYCVNGVCEARTGAGQSCKNDTECSKSNPKCVDGVCCNVACAGQCEACDVKGQEGTCTPVTGGPHGKRTACRGDGSSCNGTCAGKLRSSCDFSDPQTVCQDAACDAKTGMAVEQAFCDGAGNCAKTDPMDCTPFTCGATACRGNCATDAQCVAGSFCKAGVCVDLEKPGNKCARDGQCASGFCTDGVCCEGRCDGQCESCGGGKCQPTVGAPAGMRAPCSGDIGDACAGTCDGTSRATCGYPAGEVVCRDAACDAGTATVAAHCDGGGACAPKQSVTCKNGCEGTICAGDACTVNADCKPGEQCLAGGCAPQGDNGAACSSASDCGSGFCVDGVCCDRACDGQCEACDGGKKAGICAPVSGAPHGGRVPCTTDGSACAGACDGKEPSGCSYPNGTVCAAGSCTPGKDGAEAVATVEAVCNGNGRCPAARDQACGGVGCDAKQQKCNGDCADGSACGKGQYCSAGVCVASEPSGTACQAAGDCASGFCVDGYCCSTACDDRCAACDVPGSLGQCSPVTGSTHGGRPGCQGGGACGSQCDGKSVTDCSFPDKTTSCGAAYCNSGAAVAASTCDGAGQCQAGEQTACASFGCDGDQCSAACKTDADCTRTFQCHEGECVPPYKIDAKDQGTCGCRAPGSRPASNGGWLALVAVSLLSLRRRRSRAA